MKKEKKDPASMVSKILITLSRSSRGELIVLFQGNKEVIDSKFPSFDRVGDMHRQYIAYW